MSAFFGIVGFLGFFISLVIIIIKAIRKRPLKKTTYVLLGCVVSFIIGLSIPSSPRSQSVPVTAPTTTTGDVSSKATDDKAKADAEAKAKVEAEEKAKAEADAKAKAEAEAKKKAEEEAKKAISDNFATFEAPYAKMTDLQKDKFYETVENKYVQWTGKVSEVKEDSVMVICLDTTFVADFMAYVNDDQKNKLLKLNKDQTITIKGKITGQEGSFLPWSLTDAVIVK